MATAYKTSAETTHTGLDKIARYGWKVKNSPGKLEYISKRKLVVGAEYQRDGDTPSARAKILHLSREWDWMACGVIVVAKVGGKFRVIDGQHRKLAADRRSDIDGLPCLVFEPEEVAQEARAFLALNTLNKPVSAIDKHRAKLIANDEYAVKIEETLSRLGLFLTKRATKIGDFGAIAWAYRKAAEDYENFVTVVEVTSEICAADGIPIPEKLLDGMWYINQVVEGGLLGSRLNARIRHVGAQRLYDGVIRASAYFARGGARVFATGMIDVLNKGIHTKFELPS